MDNTPLAPALTADEWKEWRTYRSRVWQETRDPVRAAQIALQTMARNNDLLPDDSAYKFTRDTLADLKSAADCLRKSDEPKSADSLLMIARMLEASLPPD